MTQADREEKSDTNASCDIRNCMGKGRLRCGDDAAHPCPVSFQGALGVIKPAQGPPPPNDS